MQRSHNGRINHRIFAGFRTKPEVELERADTKRTNRSDSNHDLGANTIR